MSLKYKTDFIYELTMSYLYYNSLNEEKENFTHITIYIYCSFIWALPRHFEEALFLQNKYFNLS